MKFFLGKSSQNTSVDRSRYKDIYEFKKSVLHGFPTNPNCIAYDHYHKLLAIGTKSGSVQIYGKPGVEFYYQFENELDIIKLIFISKHGQLLCFCSDYSLHLLKLPSEPGNQLGITKLQTNYDFVSEADDIDIITTIAINPTDQLLYIGMKSGDIILFDITNFALKNDIIKQEIIIKSLKEELKLKPGSVEAIEEHPENNGKILIGYSRCLIAYWDYINKKIENYFLIEQHLEHLSWNQNGEDFISCHNDGSYNCWSIKQDYHECKQSNSKLTYGPFPCKAIKKIFWNKCINGEYFIFNGGMPRASYSDKETMSVIHYPKTNINEKSVVFDLTSKIIDFLVIFSDTDSKNELQALIILSVEELIVIDLKNEDWPQFKLPYLACLHSSSITCSQYFSNVQNNIYKQIVECTSESNFNYSTNNWPIDGGFEAKTDDNLEPIYNVLITGHEDGTVKFWDATTISLRHLHTVNTSKLFNVSEDDLALIDGDDNELSNDEEQEEWPPFRKVGHFDPYSDDPRLAIRKLSFCPENGTLSIGGTAGQLLIYEFRNKTQELSIPTIDVKIIDEKDSFVWKGHNSLTRKTVIKVNSGYQPITAIQLYPPAAITALTFSTSWQVIGAGTAHGFVLFDYSKNVPVITKSTLKLSNTSSIMGGDALISRRKSFKKSLRESFRRLRRSRSQKSKRNVNTNTNSAIKNSAKVHEVNRLAKFEKIEPKPIERPVEATRTSEEDLMSSMVRHLYLCSSPIISNQMYPTFLVGTNSGAIFFYVLATKNSSPSLGTHWFLVKDVQLKHKAPIIFIRLLDVAGAEIMDNYQHLSDEKSFSRILIGSEEQFKMFTIPNFKALSKFKLTAHEGARVRRYDIGKFYNKTNNNHEYSLMCLTNLGDVNIFSVNDFQRRFQHHFLKKEDIHGISSLFFTNNGEGYYLKSSSEYQRFSLSAKKLNFLDCSIRLAKVANLKQTSIINDNISNIETKDNNKLSLCIIKKPQVTDLDSVVTPTQEKEPTNFESLSEKLSNNTSTETVVKSITIEKKIEESKTINGITDIANVTNGSVCVE